MEGEDSELKEKCSELMGTHFTIGKINSDDNSGFQNVKNRINCRIPPNSKQISQQSLHMVCMAE